MSALGDSAMQRSRRKIWRVELETAEKITGLAMALGIIQVGCHFQYMV